MLQHVCQLSVISLSNQTVYELHKPNVCLSEIHNISNILRAAHLKALCGHDQVRSPRHVAPFVGFCGRRHWEHSWRQAITATFLQASALAHCQPLCRHQGMSAIQQTLSVTLCTSGAFWECVAKGDPGPLVILQAPQFQSNQSIFQESDSYICLAWYIIQSNGFIPVDRVHLQHHNAVVCALPSPLLQNLQQYSALDLDIFLCMLSKAC